MAFTPPDGHTVVLTFGAGYTPPDGHAIVLQFAQFEALAVTEVGDTLSAAGVLSAAPRVGTATDTEVGDAVAAAATVRSHAALTKTETGDNESAAVSHNRNAALSKTEAKDRLSSDGTSVLLKKHQNAKFKVTEGSDTTTAAASHPRVATFAKTEVGDRLVAFLNQSAIARPTEHGDTTSAAAANRSHATTAVTEVSDTLTSAPLAKIVATLSKTEVGDDLEAADHVLIDARMRESGAGDTVTADASSNAAVYGQFFELDDFSTPAFEATVAIAASSSNAEAGDTLVASKLTAVTAAIAEVSDTLNAAESLATDTNVTDAGDATSAAGVVLTNAYGIAVESSDYLNAADVDLIAASASLLESGDNTTAAGTLAGGGTATADCSAIESPDLISGTSTCAIAANSGCFEHGDSCAQTVAPAVGGGWSYKRKLRKDEIEELLRREREFARIVAATEPAKTAIILAEVPVEEQNNGTLESAKQPAKPHSYVAELLEALAKKSTPVAPETVRTLPAAAVEAVGAPAPIDDDLVMAAIKHYYGEDVEIIDEPYRAPTRKGISAEYTPQEDELLLEAAIHFYYAEAA